MAGFKQIRKRMEEAQIEKQHEEKLIRCIPAAREMLTVFSKHSLGVPMGDVAPNDEGYVPVAEDMLAVLLKHDVRWSEREFVFQLMLQAVNFPKDLALQSLDRSWNAVITALVGKPALELKTSEVDALIRKGDTITEQSKKNMKDEEEVKS